MLLNRPISLFLVALLFSSGAFAQTEKIISGSTEFSVKFILGTCHGTFDQPNGKAVFNEKNPSSSAFDLKINAASFQTGNDSRDKDMKSEKYFFIEKYHQIHFKSTKVARTGDKYEAAGNLTIRDVSKTVTLPFQAEKRSDGSYALSSTFEINRLDYHIGEKDWKLKDIVTVTLKAVAR